MEKKQELETFWLLIVVCVLMIGISVMLGQNNYVLGSAKGGGGGGGPATRFCTDSDQGLDYYVKGSISGSMPRKLVPYDSCLSQTTLRETFCGANNYGSAVQYTCSNGCLDGACNPEFIQPVEVPPECGNGIIEHGEECDDGNIISGDGCSSLCAIEAVPKCGDSIVQPAIGEDCDGSTAQKSCLDYGYLGGTLQCIGCKLDISQCTMCNNNGICDLALGEGIDNCPGDCLVSPTGASVYVVPRAVAVSNNQQLAIDIAAYGTADLYGFQFDVSYDPLMMRFDGIQLGQVFGNYQHFCINATASSGILKNIVCTELGSNVAVSSGTLATISFTSIAPGTSQIGLANVKLINSNSNTISASVNNGQVIVS